MNKIEPKELTKAEIAKIASTAGGDKRRCNYEVYIDQLLAHIAWLTQNEVQDERQISGK